MTALNVSFIGPLHQQHSLPATHSDVMIQAKRVSRQNYTKVRSIKRRPSATYRPRDDDSWRNVADEKRRFFSLKESYGPRKTPSSVIVKSCIVSSLQPRSKGCIGLSFFLRLFFETDYKGSYP